MTHNRSEIVYASFDRFPSAKGAAIHIDAFIRTLGNQFGNTHLVTIPSETSQLAEEQTGVLSGTPQFAKNQTDLPEEVRWSADGVQHHQVPAIGPNLFERVLNFRAGFRMWWQRTLGARPVDTVHFRSIYEGYPIARQKELFC